MVKQDLRAIRQGKGLTYAQLSALSGVPLTVCWDAENTARVPTLRNALRIAGALGRRVEAIEWGYERANRQIG